MELAAIGNALLMLPLILSPMLSPMRSPTVAPGARAGGGILLISRQLRWPGSGLPRSQLCRLISIGWLNLGPQSEHLVIAVGSSGPSVQGGELGDKSSVLVPFVNVQSHCFAQIALIRATGAQAAVTVREVGFHLGVGGEVGVGFKPPGQV